MTIWYYSIFNLEKLLTVISRIHHACEAPPLKNMGRAKEPENEYSGKELTVRNISQNQGYNWYEKYTVKGMSSSYI